MNILLIAPDSKIRNLAIMKSNTYYKGQGHNVGFNIANPDMIIASILFSKNRYMVNSWKIMYPGVRILVGGPGYDPRINLDLKIDQCNPDYSIYPQYEGSIGRTTIGCIRKCYFCVVPLMGGIRYVQHIREYYNGGVVRIIDDNILAIPGAFEETAVFLIANNITADFENFDIRLIDEKNANMIANIRHNKSIRFAFDLISYRNEVKKGIGILENAGLRPSRLMFYVYINDESKIKDAMKRWGILRDLGAEPFLMVNKDNITPRLKRIRRRGDRPAIWRGLTVNEVFA